MPKYKIFPTQQAAEAELKKIYAGMVRLHANQRGGSLRDLSMIPPVDRSSKIIPEGQLTGDKYPILGRRASDLTFNEISGFTTAWAIPVQISDGRWVFPSPDNTGVDADPSWWPTVNNIG